MRFPALAAAMLLHVSVTGLASAQRGGMGGGAGNFGGMGRPQFPVPDLPGPELDGPPDSAAAVRIMSLSPDLAGRYAQAYDSFMVVTRPTRDSVAGQLDLMRDKLDLGDRAAAMFYAERATRMARPLKDRQKKFDDQVAKIVSGEQMKAYRKWLKEQEDLAKERRQDDALAWRDGGGAFPAGRSRGAAGERKTVVSARPSVKGMDGIADAVRAGGNLFVSAQVALDSTGRIVGEGDLRAQAGQAFANLGRVLAAGRADPDNIVRLTVYVVDYRPEHLAIIKEAGARYLPERLAPALTVVGVQSLHLPGLLVAVDAIAVVDPPRP